MGMVWRLSHWLCPCIEDSPAQRKVGATSAQNQFESAGSTTKVYNQGWNEWKLFATLIFLYTGNFLSTRSTRLGELVSLLSWSRGGLVLEWWRLGAAGPREQQTLKGQPIVNQLHGMSGAGVAGRGCRQKLGQFWSYS